MENGDKHGAEKVFFRNLLDRYFPGDITSDGTAFEFGPLTIAVKSDGKPPEIWAPFIPIALPPPSKAFQFFHLWGIPKELVENRSDFGLTLGAPNQVQFVWLDDLLLINLYTHTLVIIDAGRNRALGMTDNRLGDQTRDWALMLTLTTLVPTLLCRDGILTFHASAAELNDVGMIFPGAKGCGKSSLAYALKKRGFTILADDTAMVDPTARIVFPSPEYLRLPGAHAPKAPLPESEKRLIPLGDDNQPRNRFVSLGGIIFPQRTDLGATKLHTISRADAMRRLMSCLISPPYLVESEKLVHGIELLAMELLAGELHSPDPVLGAEKVESWLKSHFPKKI